MEPTAVKPSRPEVEPGVRRISRRYLVDSIMGAFYLEKGLLFTLKMMFLRPGKGVHEFLFTSGRDKYSKPLGFLILSSTIAAIVAINFSVGIQGFVTGLNEGLNSPLATEQAEGTTTAEEDIAQKEEARQKVLKQAEDISNFYYQHFNLSLILYVPFSAFTCFLFFRKDKWYYTEHLVSNAYLIGVQNVISIPFFLAANYLSTWVLALQTILSLGYQVYFLNRVYLSAKGFTGMLRILGSMILATLLYAIFMIIVVLIVYFKFIK